MKPKKKSKRGRRSLNYKQKIIIFLLEVEGTYHNSFDDKKRSIENGQLDYIDSQCYHNNLCAYQISSPESANFDELRDEVATEVKSHEGFKAADAGSTDEHGGGRILRRDTAVSPGRRRWRRREGSDLMVVEFDDGRVNPDGSQELLHDVTHATRGPAEDYDRVFRYQPPDSFLGGLLFVDGKTGAAEGGGGARHGQGSGGTSVEQLLGAGGGGGKERKRSELSE
ncbi:hypothetical protein V6N12_015711 [Hibiscus sabdariffa]|uniref:Uncharacterized protein n=1 Tax=Hibiscus sabdariffa TaxID=183260 RepID=A0ABR2DNY0_9ROSI